MSSSLKRSLTPYLLGLPTALWLGIFFVVPLLAILSVSLMTGNALDGYTLTWNFSIFGDAISTYSTQFLRSFLYGGISTAVALVAMYPVAYWVAFYGGRFKSALLFLLLLPFFVSFVIRIIAWQFILADDGIVLGTLKDIGVVPESMHVLSTPSAVVAGLTYDALPFMLLPLYVSLQRIDRSQIEAAADLYASKYDRFRTVILPLSAPGIYAGIVLVAITNIGDYVSAAILGGPSTTMIGNVIQTQYVQNADYPIASALALILMATLLVAMGVYAKVFGTRTLQEHAT
ncbi:MAG: ABC transporter permease [Solirubrobacterales bacterium]|nr:ABC transporter permease [Solirubrobacterales bacterium]MCO5328282.1 ABC transporter permease [Solirubrobacterales bacterium]